MEYLIGIALAATVAAFAAGTGLAGERAFYPTVAIVVASYYDLFATLGADPQAIVVESLAGIVFVVLAVLGFRVHPAYAAAALVGHGLFDLVHPHAIDNPGVPAWWPGFCMAFDVALGAIVLLRLRRTSAASGVGGAASRPALHKVP